MSSYHHYWLRRRWLGQTIIIYSNKWRLLISCKFRQNVNKSDDGTIKITFTHHTLKNLRSTNFSYINKLKKKVVRRQLQYKFSCLVYSYHICKYVIISSCLVGVILYIRTQYNIFEIYTDKKNEHFSFYQWAYAYLWDKMFIWPDNNNAFYAPLTRLCSQVLTNSRRSI